MQGGQEPSPLWFLKTKKGQPIWFFSLQENYRKSVGLSLNRWYNLTACLCVWIWLYIVSISDRPSNTQTKS